MNPEGAQGAPRHALMLHFASGTPFGRGLPGGSGLLGDATETAAAAAAAAAAADSDPSDDAGDGSEARSSTVAPLKEREEEEPDAEPVEPESGEAPDSLLTRQLWEVRSLISSHESSTQKLSQQLCYGLFPYNP